MSNSVQPRRQQPTRFPCPWDSPGTVAQLCPTLSDPLGCSPPDYSIHGIVQASVLDWVAISFSVLLDYFSILSFWFVQVITHVRTFFFFLMANTILLYVYIRFSLSIHLISGPLGCFHLWASVSSAARNTGVQASLQDHAFNSSEHIPNVDLVDHTEI